MGKAIENQSWEQESTTRGLSSNLVGQLLMCGKGLAGVYLCDPLMQRAVVPKAGQLDRSVECLLRFHKKRVFTFNREPSLQQVSNGLINVANKIARRQHFSSGEGLLTQWRHL
eukprot:35696-Pyramimonas_sp.AAC.1